MTAESHSPGLVRGLHSPYLDRGEEPHSPSFLASVNLFHALLDCQDIMAPVSLDLGAQSLHFQKRILFRTVMDQEALHLSDLVSRSHQSLLYSLGNMGHLPMGTTGDSHLLILVGPEEEHQPNMKTERILMERKGSSRTRHTTR